MVAEQGNGTGPAEERTFDTLDEIVRHEMERFQIPGMTVGTLINGDVRTHGYGVISLATNYPTQPDTLFQIGSNTKVFTATLAMQLHKEGLLDLDTPVKEYLPDLQLADEQALATITMRHLLTHMSGLEGDRFDDFGVGDDALAKGIEQAYTWAQETDPGEIWSYCNSGFYLAGRVLEVLLEQPFETGMRERLFAPLGMQRTFWFAHEAITYSAAAGHVQLPGQAQPEVAHPYAIPRAANPAGAIIANVEDLLTFLRFHMGDGSWNGERLLSEESIQAMRQPQARVNTVTEWGLGWTLREIDGVQVISHGGSTNGHNTQMLAVPEQGFAITVLANSSRGSSAYEPIINWALERYCGLKEPQPEHLAMPAAELERYSGRYARPMGSTTITVEDGGLSAVATMKNPFNDEETTLPAFRLAPIGNDEFIAIDGDFKDMRAEFIMGDGDRPRYIRFGYRLVERED